MTLQSSRCFWALGRSGFRRLSGVSGVAAGEGDPAPSGRGLATFAKAAVGIFAVGGSGLGLWLLSDSADTSFANSSDPRLNGCSEAAAEDKKPRFLFGGFTKSPSSADLEDLANIKRAKEKYLYRIPSLRLPSRLPALQKNDTAIRLKCFRVSGSFRRRVFFKYEKRLRLQSSPEKIFEYFASIRSPEGEVFMSPVDLMRAVVPVFPSSESSIVKEGCLRGEQKPGLLHCASSPLFLLFDTNNDGLISFPEYIFFVTLLSIPDSSFSAAFKMFDLDNNGAIERDEFKKVMALMRSYNRQGACHRNGLRIGLKVRGSVENAGLVEYFFGKDGNERLQHDKFVKFLRDLHDEILRLEFDHYDVKSKGAISAKDFALSMVASADINHVNKFLDRVDVLDKNLHLKDMSITFEEFKAFADLRKRLDLLSFAIYSYGKVNGFLAKEDFIRAASHVCGISLSDSVVDIVYHVFDLNNDGHLSSEEFLRVMQKREIDIRQPTSTSLFRHSFMLP